MLDALMMIGASLGSIVLAILALAALKPGTFYVRRSLTIDAPPERTFPLISNLRSMNAWNPFAHGPAADATAYSGPEDGLGAAYDWDIPGRAGAGRIAITDAQPSYSIDMDLVMRRPMACTRRIRFTIEPAGSASDVTWAIMGPWPYSHHIVDAFFSVDETIGDSLEKGLQDLKARAEKG